ncbi:SAM-dependent methyltransferase [Solihabitans fulvus]|uniref:S-adenosyl-L-methionine-dependent methyltransferase n=1 Tax=Solihabitans fulvus TaxID=1892852 RepID=A0A5B2XCL6_9PSEU|nr:SAM-dependent methyltransferase [Solihabitans fulvus]KAA2260946.1 SAM-dependent methyltransferase [Solihabitans fulvus]
MPDERRPPAGVSRTATLIAQARAGEHARADRLFTDPLAGPLAEAVGGTPDLAGVLDLAGEHFVLRTRYFDDYLRKACAGGCAQVVLLASGLDTRAYRMDWPHDVRVFELDLPDLLAFKDEVLADAGARPNSRRIVVPVDLTDDWPAALLAAGFDPDRPTAWLVEGLLMFLSNEANDLLLDRISDLSCVGSTIAIEHFNPAFRALPQMRPVHDRFAELDALAASSVEDPVAWLGRRGWQAEVTDQVDLAREHTRPVPRVVDPALVGDARIWLASAVFTPPE